MKRNNLVAIFSAAPPAILLLFCRVAAAQTEKVAGLIIGRSGSTMTLQTPSEPKLVVLLTGETQVGQVHGVLKARRKPMSMTALMVRETGVKTVH
jgi:hypothetical protein